ncbi:uncharacterized protein BX664DRAFT_321753 [Halteromyces radiatus]|uniref:uncharacterized protein n=1 Tax=Halteromyces radiatus TaxID=101107 RepID=UPI00221FE1CB|nr:uncharacterized protein BX664DRAFT_321753 [Halteromyces radiatus]KAI8099619.1 hypothetical protein BX664DRAFT_321753 [Halteromyces radiatus]
MLRINPIRLGQQVRPTVRSSSLFAIRHESTTSDAPTQKPTLSQRLGGSGRGKLMPSSGQETDVFASFLAQAQKKQQRSRNKQKRPQQAKPGQFDDAVETSSNKKTDNKQQQQQRRQQQKTSSGKGQQQQQVERKPRQQQRRDIKKSTSYGSPSSVPVRRTTTFIDKDFDWASLNPVISTNNVEETTIDPEEKKQMEMELNDGDYTRFMSIGQSIQWPSSLDTHALESLVSSNASYGLDQKMTFLSTVAKASNVGGAAAKK